jgi:hypothetical protein
MWRRRGQAGGRRRQHGAIRGGGHRCGDEVGGVLQEDGLIVDAGASGGNSQMIAAAAAAAAAGQIETGEMKTRRQRLPMALDRERCLKLHSSAHAAPTLPQTIPSRHRHRHFHRHQHSMRGRSDRLSRCVQRPTTSGCRVQPQARAQSCGGAAAEVLSDRTQPLRQREEGRERRGVHGGQIGDAIGRNGGV